MKKTDMSSDAITRRLKQTEQLRKLSISLMSAKLISDEEAANVAKLTALGRWGSPRDIANAVYFLLDNDFINGSVLVVDGGRSITL